MQTEKQEIKTEIRKRISVNKKEKKTAVEDKERIFGGRYHCDYSPRYEEAYDIYEKARSHMKQMKGTEQKEKNQKKK